MYRFVCEHGNYVAHPLSLLQLSMYLSTFRSTIPARRPQVIQIISSIDHRMLESTETALNIEDMRTVEEVKEERQENVLTKDEDEVGRPLHVHESLAKKLVHLDPSNTALRRVLNQVMSN